jgi:hypothetical protein
MAVQKDNTLALHSEEVFPNDPIESTDVENILKRINAQEEMITDVMCTGGAARTYRGHDHCPGSAGTPGRGILRSCIGYFQVTRSAHPYMLLTLQGVTPSSWSADAGSTIYEEAGDKCPPNVGSIMGMCLVSPGIESIRVEICASANEALTAGPQMRVKNLTDSTGMADTKVVASPWVDLDSTSIKWYGSLASDIITVPVTYSSTAKTVYLDIECRLSVNTTATEFRLYEAFAYEYTDQK